jgi:hypothetical protein
MPDGAGIGLGTSPPSSETCKWAGVNLPLLTYSARRMENVSRPRKNSVATQNRASEVRS